jgi:hypothetical protein
MLVTPMEQDHTFLWTLMAYVVVVVNATGCGNGPTTPTTPDGPTYRISGVMTTYGGGAASGVDVTAFGGNRQTHTLSDAQGHYSLSSPSAGPVWLGFGKAGYAPGLKTGVSGDNSTFNFTLDRSFVVDAFHVNGDSFYLNPAGDTVTGTISGDELLPGDDVSFGGMCAHTPCRLIDIGSVSAARIEIRLRWKNAATQLALYVSQQPYWEGAPPSPPLVPAERHCCSSELAANVLVDSYAGAWVAIAFERAAAGPPLARDTETFELTVQPPR